MKSLNEIEKQIVKIALKNEKDILKTISAILLVLDNSKRKVKEELRINLQRYVRADDHRLDYPRLALALTVGEMAEYKARVKQMKSIAEGDFYLTCWLNQNTRRAPRTRLQAILIYMGFSMASFTKDWLEWADNDLNAISERTFDEYLSLHNKYSEKGLQTNILDTEWNDGYSNKSVKDRIMDNNDKVILALMLMLEKEMVSNPLVSEVDKLVDRRYQVQQGDVRRHMETYTTLSTNQGLLLAYEFLGECLRHVSVLDNRTTELCRSRDGKVFPLSEAKFGVTIPPLHWKCRSIVVSSPCG